MQCHYMQCSCTSPSAAAGVPYSAVVYAVNGAGRGAESEQVTFFAKELSKLHC